MKTLNILTGAGINQAISNERPEIKDLIGFTYQSISRSVHDKLDGKWREMFSPESFDYILGALITMSSVIDKTKEDLVRYQVNQNAFGELFHQSALRDAIESSYKKIEDKLLINSNDLINVIRFYNPSISSIQNNFEKINYFTLNFDGVFDHVIYGEKDYEGKLIRGNVVTDSWAGVDFTDYYNGRKFRICHLHGDIRYKPHKVSKAHPAKRLWPVLVVGDLGVKKGLIAGSKPLSTYYKYYKEQFSILNRDSTLLIAGFGFRDEDQHISSRVKMAIENKIFGRVVVYDAIDRLSSDNRFVGKYEFIDAKAINLSTVLNSM